MQTLLLANVPTYYSLWSPYFLTVVSHPPPPALQIYSCCLALHILNIPCYLIMIVIRTNGNISLEHSGSMAVVRCYQAQ